MRERIDLDTFLSYFSRFAKVTFQSYEILNKELLSFPARTQDMDKFSSFAEDVTLARF